MSNAYGITHKNNFKEFFPEELADFFNLAHKAALQSYASHKHGAVVVKDGQVISVGHNKPHIDYDMAGEDGKWEIKHAETEAIQGVEEKLLVGATIVVCKISETGSVLGYSRPCEYCRMVLPSFGIRNVIYSTDHPPYFREEVFSP